MRYCRDHSRDKVNEIANALSSALDGKVSSGILEDCMLKTRMTWGPAKLRIRELCVLTTGSPTTGKIRLDGPKNSLVVLISNRTPMEQRNSLALHSYRSELPLKVPLDYTLDLHTCDRQTFHMDGRSTKPALGYRQYHSPLGC